MKEGTSMYSKIVGRYPYDTQEEFGIEYVIEGEDQEGKPFEAVASFGFVYDEEDDVYYLTCSVIWNGTLDYITNGDIMISPESIERGRFSSSVESEMGVLMEEIIRQYPEFEDVQKFLGW
jgi:hypothetical protein